MNHQEPEDYTMEMGPMGPIGEAESLILRANRNCPWNHCLFCPAYKGRSFSVRSVPEIKADIDVVRRVCESLERTSRDRGLDGLINREVIEQHIRSKPGLYGEYPINVSKAQWGARHTLRNVAGWMLHGAKKVFLQDADAILMKPGELLEVLQYIKKSFPAVESVSSYARSRTCNQRTLNELKEFNEAGLSWCYVGIESGSDEVLTYMKKGASRKDHICGGQKLIGAGIRMAAFVMPGLAGAGEKFAERHIHDTIQVLNEIRPTEIRVRSLAIQEGTPLHKRWERGEFKSPTEDQMVDELRQLVGGLTFDCSIETLQLTNVFTMQGRLFVNREEYLKLINMYQALSPMEKAYYLLSRYMYAGYLECVRSRGLYDSSLHSLILDAVSGLGEHAEDCVERVDRAIFAIKSKCIP